MTPRAVRAAVEYVSQKLPGREVKITNDPEGNVVIGVWSIRLGTHICGTMPDTDREVIPFATELVDNILEAERDARTATRH